VRWCSDGDFLAIFLCPAFPESHVQHISDLNSKFALEPHHVYGKHPSNLQLLRLVEEKKIDRKKPQGKNIMSTSAMQGSHKKLKCSTQN